MSCKAALTKPTTAACSGAPTRSLEQAFDRGESDETDLHHQNPDLGVSHGSTAFGPVVASGCPGGGAPTSVAPVGAGGGGGDGGGVAAFTSASTAFTASTAGCRSTGGASDAISSFTSASKV